MQKKSNEIVFPPSLCRVMTGTNGKLIAGGSADTLLPADFSLEHLSLLSFTHISSFPREGALRSK